ncbi:transcription factor 15 [Neophocaena asiaeorientalis asiaeorientalis]|uniref:Transcription factor 15 n=1 Tax=Neophocaena asiaeorientalis asiaeorientalis TaxID=1706337 RepID=A0A341B9H0_NEOAA|nr:transcription factor 15 [Neophocaena asiaeorientalis asiaeorientalis]
MTSAAANPLVPAPRGSAEQSALCGGAVPSPGALPPGPPPELRATPPGRQPCNVFQAARLLPEPRSRALLPRGGSPDGGIWGRPQREVVRAADLSPGRERGRGRRHRRQWPRVWARGRVNTAFTALRTLIPTEPVDRKLSKIETLRLASSYIAHLANVLLLGDAADDGQPCFRAAGTAKSAVPAAPDGGRQPRSICTFCLSNQRKGGSRRDLGGSCLKVRGVAPVRVPRR